MAPNILEVRGNIMLLSMEKRNGDDCHCNWCQATSGSALDICVIYESG